MGDKSFVSLVSSVRLDRVFSGDGTRWRDNGRRVYGQGNRRVSGNAWLLAIE